MLQNARLQPWSRAFYKTPQYQEYENPLASFCQRVFIDNSSHYDITSVSA